MNRQSPHHAAVWLNREEERLLAALARRDREIRFRKRAMDRLISLGLAEAVGIDCRATKAGEDYVAGSARS